MVREKPVHAWTRWYWPSAIVVAVLSFFIPWLAGASLTVTGIGLSAGALLLGVPELLAFATGNLQDTLSDWVWNSLGVTGFTPVSRWDAGRLLFAVLYLTIVGCVQAYLFDLATVYWQFWALFGLGLGFFGVWLLFHFFERWWA